MGVVGRLDQYASMLATEFDDYSMSENLVTYSEQFDNAAWTKSNVSITANTTATTAPDGTNSAEKIIESLDVSTTFHVINSGFSATSGISYTYSIFVKSAERTKVIIGFDTGSAFSNFQYGLYDLSAGTSSIFLGTPTVSITPYPNGWYRCSVTAVATGTASATYALQLYTTSNGYIGNGTSGIYIWGAQVEAGTVATSYTQTTTTAISRVLPSTTNTSITGLGTYYSSGFDENVGFTTSLSANVFTPYDPVYDEFSGTLFGAGQGRYMRQNADKSLIVYNEIDEITFTGTLIASTTSLNEGSTVTFNVTNVSPSTTLYWTLNAISGTINASDFNGGAVSGSFSIDSGGSGSVALTLANDLTVEGTESFQLQLRIGSTSGTIIATSSTVTIADTSVTTVTPSTTILDEGSTVTFNVTNSFASTTLYWTLTTIGGAINTSDFSGGAVSGSFSTDGSGSGSVALTLANDSATEGPESFQLQVRTGSTSGTIIATSSTVNISDTSRSELFAFTSFTFTNATAEGTLGPTLANLQSAYSAQSWSSNTNYLNLFNSTRGYQRWTVPTSGTYRITAAGAQGGAGKWNTYYGGFGAIMRCTISLTQGDYLIFVVGQRGGYNDTISQGSSGGGGGTFVFKDNLSTPVLIAGGGGGGGGNSGPQNGKSGETTNNGGTNSSAQAGGSAGSGGPAYSGGGGGAGLTGSGGTGVDTAAGGLNITTGTGTGGRGGSCAASQTATTGGRNFGSLGQDQGGFGGGAGGEWCSVGGVGGGGGYSGGAGNNSSTGVGGGGGSYFNASLATLIGTSNGTYNAAGSYTNLGYNGSTTLNVIFSNSMGYVTMEKI